MLLLTTPDHNSLMKLNTAIFDLQPIEDSKDCFIV